MCVHQELCASYFFLHGILGNFKQRKTEERSDLHNEVEVMGYKCRSVGWKRKS